MSMLTQFFTWWNGSTIGTNFFTWRHGSHVGCDSFGNRYYEGSLDKNGRPRRWVVYKKYSDPTTIPSGWYGWMHHTTNVYPESDLKTEHAWQKPRQPNLTGTAFSYRPKGAIASKEKIDAVTGTYQAWVPNTKKHDL